MLRDDWVRRGSTTANRGLLNFTLPIAPAVLGEIAGRN